MSIQETTGRSSGASVALIVIGALVMTVAVVILAGAVALQWANGKRDANGYFNSGFVHVGAEAFAITSENVEIDTGFLDFVGADRAQLRVRSSSPIFVGVGSPEDVAAYLGDAERALLTDVDFAPFNPTYEILGGTGKPRGQPAAEPFWIDQAVGEGERTIEWDTKGRWAVVIMRPDASRGVDATVSAGLQSTLVGTLAWIVTAAGLIVCALGALLIYLGVRKRRRRPSSPAGSAWGA